MASGSGSGSRKAEIVPEIKKKFRIVRELSGGFP
jgi:hypothetical protein